MVNGPVAKIIVITTNHDAVVTTSKQKHDGSYKLKDKLVNTEKI